MAYPLSPWKASIAALLLAASGFGAYAFFRGKEEARPLLAWQDAEVVARGHAVYDSHCSGCHGLKGEGQPASADKLAAPPHDATGHTWQHPDFALVQLTKQGVSSVACMTLDENAMPKFDTALSDREILDVLSYVKSRWPADIVAQQEKTNSLYASHNDVMWDLLELTP